MVSVLRRLFDATYKRFAPESYARSIGVKLGKGCRLIQVSFSSEPYMITLGDRVSATATRFETHDGAVWVCRDEVPEIDLVRPIVVGSNVFIGYGSIILPGVTIGDDVVIGAGSVVTNDIPSGSVAAGVPARVIKSTQQYKEKVLALGALTKSLDSVQKRRFYEPRAVKLSAD